MSSAAGRSKWATGAALALRSQSPRRSARPGHDVRRSRSLVKVHSRVAHAGDPRSRLLERCRSGARSLAAAAAGQTRHPPRLRRPQRTRRRSRSRAPNRRDHGARRDRERSVVSAVWSPQQPGPNGQAGSVRRCGRLADGGSDRYGQGRPRQAFRAAPTSSSTCATARSPRARPTRATSSEIELVARLGIGYAEVEMTRGPDSVTLDRPRSATGPLPATINLDAGEAAPDPEDQHRSEVAVLIHGGWRQRPIRVRRRSGGPRRTAPAAGRRTGRRRAPRGRGLGRARRRAGR